MTVTYDIISGCINMSIDSQSASRPRTVVSEYSTCGETVMVAAQINRRMWDFYVDNNFLSIPL